MVRILTEMAQRRAEPWQREGAHPAGAARKHLLLRPTGTPVAWMIHPPAIWLMAVNVTRRA